MQLKSHSDEYMGNFLGHENEIRTLIFSHDKKTLISGGWDTRIHVWPLDVYISTGRKIRKPIASIKTHSDSITSLYLTKDQQYLISGSKDGKVQVHDLTDLKSIQTILNLNENKGRIFTISMNPLENTLVSGGEEKIIHIWTLDLNEKLNIISLSHDQITHPGGIIHGMQFNPDGTHILVFGDDATIYIYQYDPVQTPNVHLEKNFTYHRKWVYAAVFHPILPMIISGGQEKKCYFYNYLKDEIIHDIPLSAPVVAIHCSPDGQYIVAVTLDNDLHLISTETGQICATHHIAYGSRITVGLSSDWSLLAVAPFGISPPVIKVWRFSL